MNKDAEKKKEISFIQRSDEIRRRREEKVKERLGEGFREKLIEDDEHIED